MQPSHPVLSLTSQAVGVPAAHLLTTGHLSLTSEAVGVPAAYLLTTT